ncbi:MAG: hypothetical protein D6732_19550 [Methanobacteriota archaeon]|nr:MAG: hypothetical protein D6732_19550 [Euryarchaeota archaeon]
MFLSTFATTYLLMLIAEFGDKTQLVALSIMTKSRKPFRVALGATIGIVFTTVLGLIAAILLSEFIDSNLIPLVSGIVFIILGVLSLKEAISKEEEEDYPEEKQIRHPFLSAVSLVALAELGDKSQLFVVGQALKGDLLAVFLGAALGMATILFTTALIGETLLKKLPENFLKYLAAALFFIAGILILLGT